MKNDQLQKAQCLDTLPQYLQSYLLEFSPLVSFTSGSVLEALAISFEQTFTLFEAIYPSHKDYAYEPEKWTIAEVIGHLIDVERIFAYRALRIARGDQEHLLGFDENEYIACSNYKNREWNSLKQELLVVEESTGYLFEGLSDNQLQLMGKADHVEISPRTIGFLIAAHRYHHIQILYKRYLTD